MILVDTSVWISHFRQGNTRLIKLLNDGYVVCHPFIIGELACGHLKNRLEILTLLKALPTIIQAQHKEILQFIENNQLMGRGLGYVDVHLIASAKLSEVLIWTADKKLAEASVNLGLSFNG